MRAVDVMTRKVITVGPGTTVREAARLFADNHISGAPVVDDEGRLLGMPTEGDLLHRIKIGTQARRRSWWLEFFVPTQNLAATYIKENARLVKDVTTPKVITVKKTTPVREIADLLERHRIKRVPVLYDGELLGIVSRANLVKALASVPKDAGTPSADQTLRDAVLQQLAGHRWAVAAENVIVNDGTVHLWNAVTSLEQARAMCIAAEKIPGVKGVEDHTDAPMTIPAM
ncbi:MAG: Inosine-5'-monophosphate dehydrogenase (EC [uncultured Caballeronia sp.]|nr:MAG: Inosine-5'-monophosphate dehydrogenase (EC [uncultured Caballeronia sp.]